MTNETGTILDFPVKTDTDAGTTGAVLDDPTLGEDSPDREIINVPVTEEQGAQIRHFEVLLADAKAHHESMVSAVDRSYFSVLGVARELDSLKKTIVEDAITPEVLERLKSPDAGSTISFQADQERIQVVYTP